MGVVDEASRNWADASRCKQSTLSYGGLVQCNGISSLVVEYIVAIDVTRVRFPADAFCITMYEPAICSGLIFRRYSIGHPHGRKKKQQTVVNLASSVVQKIFFALRAVLYFVPRPRCAGDKARSKTHFLLYYVFSVCTRPSEISNFFKRNVSFL